MEIQRVQSGNVLGSSGPYFSAPSAALSRLGGQNGNASNAPEVSAANQSLRSFWADLAPPEDDPLPHFGSSRTLTL